MFRLKSTSKKLNHSTSNSSNYNLLVGTVDNDKTYRTWNGTHGNMTFDQIVDLIYPTNYTTLKMVDYLNHQPNYPLKERVLLQAKGVCYEMKVSKCVLIGN